MNDNWKNLGEFIKAQRELSNLSLRQLATWPTSRIRISVRSSAACTSRSADVLKNIASALRISAEAMYSQAGLLDEKPVAPGDRTVEDAIKLDPALTTDQKETLIRIYQGFTERR